MKHPGIVLPGLQGSALLNYYQMSPAPMWGLIDMLQKQLFGLDFESLALHEGTSDFSDHVVSGPHHALALPYESLIDSLRTRLEVPVYAYRYDWRRSCIDAAHGLYRYLEELQQKRMASIPGWDGRFDFVCHSFGGLVFRAFLGLCDGHADRFVNRVVFVGVPHCGSLDAVDALVRGDAPIFGGRKELRKLTRTFPSAYELLPTFPGAFTAQDGGELDVFSVENWQQNVVQDEEGSKQWAVEQRRLSAAAVAISSLPPVLSEKTLSADQCLSVIGLEMGITSVSLQVKPQGPVENWFDFQTAKTGPGDGVVPLISAHVPGVDYVWVSHDNTSVLSLARLISLHAFLPCIAEVHSVISRFFEGQSGLSLLPLGMAPGQFVSARLP